MRAVFRRALICLISAQTVLVLTLTASPRDGLGTEHCMDLHFLCITDVFPGIYSVRFAHPLDCQLQTFAGAEKKRKEKRSIKVTDLLKPQLVTYLNISQDHEAQRCKVGDNEEAGVIHLWVDFSCGKKTMNHHILN